MSKEIKTINGTQYIEIESVRFEGKIYKRFIGANYMNPEVLLFDEAGNCLEKDTDLYIRIREKFAVDKNFFNGDRTILLTLEGFKKFMTGVIFAAGISGAAISAASFSGYNIVDLIKSEKAKPSISITLKSDSIKAWKKELSVIPSFKDVKVRDVDMGSKKVSDVDMGLPVAKEIEFKQIDSVIDSEKDNGKLLSSLYCAGVLCYREYSDYFIGKVQDDINELFFESDKKEFSERAANDEVLSAIAKKRGIDDVEQWYKKRMDNVEKYVYNPYDVNRSRASYNSYYNEISFSSFLFAMNKNTRAHEFSHAISHEVIDKNTDRVGLHIAKEFKTGKETKIDERGRAINEGVTNLMAEKLSGEKSKNTVYAVEVYVANQLSKKYSNEALFESYLHDVNILGDKINEDQKDPTAFTKFASALDEYHRLNNELNSSTTADKFTVITNLAKEKLREALSMINNGPKKMVNANIERELI